MKKFLAVVAVLALSACGCMSYNEEEPEVTYQNVQTRPENCDYFDGKTCYRYIRRVHQAPAVRYREPRQIEVIPEGPSCVSTKLRLHAVASVMPLRLRLQCRHSLAVAALLKSALLVNR